MREIEILVKVEGKYEKIRKVLNRFKYTGKSKIIDTYFYHPLIPQLNHTKDLRLKECLRIRAKEKKYILTYKKDHFTKKDVWIYSDEHEVIFDKGKNIFLILEKLGFRKLLTIENTRYFFKEGDYEIILERVKKLGLFIEVELKGRHKGKTCDLKKGIARFIDSLEIKYEELNMGKPELMLRKISKNKSF